MEDKYIYTADNMSDAVGVHTAVVKTTIAKIREHLKPIKKKGFKKQFFYSIEDINVIKSYIDGSFRPNEEADIDNIPGYVRYSKLMLTIPKSEDVSRSDTYIHLCKYFDFKKFGGTIYIAENQVERLKSLVTYYIDENTDDSDVPNVFITYEIRKTKDGQLVLKSKDKPDSEVKTEELTVSGIKMFIENLNKE